MTTHIAQRVTKYDLQYSDISQYTNSSFVSKILSSIIFTRTINPRFIHILEGDEVKKKIFLKEREMIPLAHMYNIIEYMYRF